MNELKIFLVTISEGDFWHGGVWDFSVAAENTRAARRVAVSVAVEQGLIRRVGIRKTDVLESGQKVFVSA